MITHPRSKRKKQSWHLLLLLIPFVVALWPGFYNTYQPELAGVPFFYWFQLLCIIATAILIAGLSTVGE